jgi:hypothetical protein
VLANAWHAFACVCGPCRPGRAEDGGQKRTCTWPWVQIPFSRMKRSKASVCVNFTHLLPEHSDAYGEFFYSEYMSIRWDKTKFRRSRGHMSGSDRQSPGKVLNSIFVSKCMVGARAPDPPYIIMRAAMHGANAARWRWQRLGRGHTCMHLHTLFCARDLFHFIFFGTNAEKYCTANYKSNCFCFLSFSEEAYATTWHQRPRLFLFSLVVCMYCKFVFISPFSDKNLSKTFAAVR